MHFVIQRSLRVTARLSNCLLQDARRRTEAMRTIYHDSDGWPKPLRAPQHAAAPIGPSLTRLQAHRALRLFVSAGTWAAGLCLVIGSIAIVVSAASPGRVAATSATSSQRGTAGQLAANPGILGRPH